MLSTKRLHTPDSWLLSTESWQATSLLKLKLRSYVKQIFMNVQNALFVKLLFLAAVQNAFLLFLISQLGQLSVFIELLSKSQRREINAHINRNMKSTPDRWAKLCYWTWECMFTSLLETWRFVCRVRNCPCMCWIPALRLASCVFLGDLLNLSVLRAVADTISIA